VTKGRFLAIALGAGLLVLAIGTSVESAVVNVDVRRDICLDDRGQSLAYRCIIFFPRLRQLVFSFPEDHSFSFLSD